MTAALLALGLAAAPAAASARDYAVQVLPNGLTVIAVSDHALPLVTVEIAFKNGAMTEPPELNGLSHLYEHMFFKGNQALSNQEAFLAKSRDLGMVFNGSTENERVDYTFTTTADELRPALQMLRDSAKAPLFDAEELRREEQVVIGEIDRDEADPFTHFIRAMDKALWKYTSYKDPLGDRATVASATVDKMRLIQGRYYVPNNAVLVIAGDVSAERAFALAGELFGGWARAGDPFVAHPIVVQPPLQSSRAVVVLQPVRTVALGFQWHGPSVGPAASVSDVRASYAADLLSIVVGQPASTFQRDLIDSGRCVRADLSWQTAAHIGPINLGLEAAEDGVDGCALAAWKELAKLADDGAYTDAELRDAATRLEVSKAREREAASQYAGVLTYFWAVAGLDYYDGYLDGIRSVTRADIRGYLSTYVLGRPFVFGALLSPETAAARKLDARHFEALLGLTKGGTK